MRLLLMRHGQTGSNLRGALDTGSPGAALTDRGLRQATEAAPLLLERGATAVFSSHLVRARQTAEPLAGRLGAAVRELPGLAEIRAGELEMREDPDAVAAYANAVLTWLVGDLGERMPGGEDGHEFLARYDEAVATVARHAASNGHGAAVVVSHGAAIRTWIRLRVANLDDWPETYRLRNTGLVELDGEPGSGWTIRDWVEDPLGGPHLDEPDPYSR